MRFTFIVNPFILPIRCAERLLMFVILYVSTSGILAQEVNLKFQHLTTKMGLPDKSVMDIVQDPYGYMWFATQNGLSRYDGLNFNNFFHERHDTTSIANDRVNSLCIHDDELFVGSTFPYTISAFNFKTERFRIVSDFKSNTSFEDLHFYQNKSFTLAQTYGNKFYIYSEKKAFFSEFLALANIIDAIKYDQLTEQSLQKTQPKEKKWDAKESHRNICFLDPLNNFYVYLDHIGVVKIDLDHFIYKIVLPDDRIACLTKASCDKELVSNLYLDQKGSLWIGIENPFELRKYNLDTKNYELVTTLPSHTEPLTLSRNLPRIRDWAESENEDLFIATETGLYVYDQQRNKAIRYNHNAHDLNSLSSNITSKIYFDKQGMLWVGHDPGGIDYSKFHRIKQFKHLDEKTSLPSNKILCIGKDIDDNPWIGTERGLVYLNRGTGKLTYFNQHKGIISLCCDSRKNTWIFDSNYNLFKKTLRNSTFEKVEFKHSNDIKHCTFFEDSKKRFWIILDDIYTYNYQKDALEKKITRTHEEITLAVDEDANGNVWMIDKSKLVMFNPEALTKKVFVSSIDDPYTLSSDILWHLNIDSENNLWVATNDGVNKASLAKLKGDRLLFETFTQQDGLPSDVIYSAFEDHNKHMWFATDQGISKMVNGVLYDKKKEEAKYHFINFDILDGVASPSLNGYFHNSNAFPCRTQLYSGEILLGVENGLTLFNPDSINADKHIPKVVFTDLKLDNESVRVGQVRHGNPILELPIEYTDSIELSYRNLMIGFDFMALEYANPSKIQYSYYLDGFYDKWMFLGNKKQVTFTNLPGGTYTLKVKATNSEGIWSDKIASMHIEVIPPFWNTGSFQTLLVVLFILLIILLLQWRTTNARIEKEHLEKLVGIRTSSLEKKNKHIEQLHKEVVEANNAKISFFTNISHELRTPLTQILGPVDVLLSKEDIDADKKRLLEMIFRNSNRLLRLINQLMDFRKVDAGQMKLSLSRGEIVSYIKELYIGFNVLAEQKKINYSFYSSIKKFDTWYDYDKIEKIVINLLSNAFKYTPNEGTIKVNLSEVNKILDNKYTRTLGSLSTNFLQISVSDTGVGIPEDKIDKVFERFYRTEESSASAVHGTGIGLALTKKLVSVHKGNISVTSRSSVNSPKDQNVAKDHMQSGSTFIVLIPLGKDHYRNEEFVDRNREPTTKTFLPHEKPDPVGSMQNEQVLSSENAPQLLIVDDNPDLREYISEVLKKTYKIQVAENGKSGYQMALKTNFDLIISDVMMPEMNGMAFCDKIKTNIITSHIPVILMTAKSDEDTHVEGLKNGADRFVSKPFSIKVLTAQIRGLIEERKKLRALFSESDEHDISSKITKTDLDAEMLSKLTNYVKDNIETPTISVDDLTQLFGLSRTIFFTKIKSLTGQTPVEFVTTVRMKSSASLLKSTDLLVKEIAYKVGFNDNHYFSKVFNRHFGLTPKEYRKINR